MNTNNIFKHGPIIITIINIFLICATAVPIDRQSQDATGMVVGKRFSMNYMDTLDPSSPESWQNQLSHLMSGSNGASGGRNTKRFSMNYHDLLQPSDPTSWRSRILGGNTKQKRFSMNYLDTLDTADPTSWQNFIKTHGSTSEKKKRFSMNYLDTIEANDPYSWENTLRTMAKETMGPRPMQGGSHARRSVSDLKRSDEILGQEKARHLAASIDNMANVATEKYGPGYICGQKTWRELLSIRQFLLAISPLEGAAADRANKQTFNCADLFPPYYFY